MGNQEIEPVNYVFYLLTIYNVFVCFCLLFLGKTNVLNEAQTETTQT